MKPRVLLASLVLLASVAPLADAGAGEVEYGLGPRAAFSIGAPFPVKDAGEMTVGAFNDTLAASHVRGESWTKSFIAIALRFAGTAAQGREQRVDVSTGPGAHFDSARPCP